MLQFFQLSEKGTTVRTELIAGLTTFLTMSYIIFVNPAILAKAGMDTEAVLVATCISAAIGTLLIGLLANFPFAQAPGMGLNAFFVFTVVLTLGYTWQQALAIVFLSGILFLLLTITGMRRAIIDAIPLNLKLAIAPGIGLFIALIGLNNAGLIDMNQGPIIDIILGSETLEAGPLIDQVVAAPPQIIELGKVSSPPVLLAIIGFALLTILMVRKVGGAMLWAILGTTLIGIPMGVTLIPETYSIDKISLSPTAFQLDLAGLFTVPEGSTPLESILTILLVVLSFTLVDLFDTLGTLLGTAAKGNMLDSEGNLPGMNKALFSDATATLIGSLLGTSSVTTYIESGSGIVAGGRTGLTAVVVAILFLFAILLAPIAGMIPAAATSPVLIMVGLLMLDGIRKLELEELSSSIPAFLLIILMPFTYSIANGIAIGMMFYVLIQVFMGKAKSVHPILYILVGLFLLRYIMI
ncbi:MAG: NCS2 family permease [Saprospiraceae bacterium]|nr:NCS2 family permease [Saprospiraceae bacterium]